MHRLVAIALVVGLVVIGTSCVTKLSQGVTDVRPEAGTGTPVNVKSGGVGVLSLTAPSLTEKTQTKLREACPDGQVLDLNSQLSRRDFFIVQYDVLKLTGTCVEPGATE